MWKGGPCVQHDMLHRDHTHDMVVVMTIVSWGGWFVSPDMIRNVYYLAESFPTTSCSVLAPSWSSGRGAIALGKPPLGGGAIYADRRVRY